MPLAVSKGCKDSCPDEAGPRVFSRDCTEDSNIPLFCEMKDEPEFKPMKVNPAFFESGNLGIHST